MALDQSVLVELLEALGVADVDDRIQSGTEALFQALTEAELTAVIGASPHERTDARTAQRNGSRLDPTTTAGDLALGSRSCAPARSPFAAGAPSADRSPW